MDPKADLRPEDMALLKRHGIENTWKAAWAYEGNELPALSTLIDIPVSESQRLWHISRMSFLKGFLVATEHTKADRCIGCDVCKHVDTCTRDSPEEMKS